MFTCCLRGRQASSLCGVRAGGCPEVGLEGWLRWLAQSLLNHFSRVQLYVTPWTVAHQTPPSMEFSRQEYWSGWPFPPPGGLPDPGLRCCCVQGACTVPCFCSQPPAFAPGASEWLVGFLVSLCLLSRTGPNCMDMTERLHFHFSLSCLGEGNGNPLQSSCLENPRDGGVWWAAIYVA